MTIKISNNGLLLLQRRGEMKKQFCPFSTDTNQYCGDWCPLFHTYNQQVELHCGSDLVIFTPFGSGETFTDERPTTNI